MPPFPLGPGALPIPPERDGRVGEVQLQERRHLDPEAAAARLSQLLRITAALSRALTAERIAEVVIGGGAEIIGARGGLVAMLDPGEEALAILLSQGYSEEALRSWRRIPLTVPVPLADAARLGEPVIVERREQLELRYPTFARSTNHYGTQAWIALPLTLDTKVIGVLGFSFAQPILVGAEERTFLMTLAGLCAQAIERARLTEAEHKALVAADEALALLDTVIDAAPIGMAVMDREFRYTRINRRLAELNGRPPAEHLGRKASELYPQGAQRWEPYWRQVLTTGRPLVDVEISAPDHQGVLRHVLVSHYPVRVGDRPLVGVGMVVLDITDRKHAEDERQRLLASEQAARQQAQAAQAQAEEALQIRDSFLSVAAHELKTPLTSLLGQAQLLERRLTQADNLNEANRRSLHVVTAQARRLRHLIGDLLDGAHLQSGQLAIDRRPLDLGRLVRQIAEDQQATAPGHTLICSIEGEPLSVRGDLARMEQVFQNLLSNALKYSSRGTTITLHARRQGDQVLVSIGDQGIGIPPEALQRLFERFYRVNTPETRAVSGVGVGLYVVREIVQLHGGLVQVQSEVGVGSTFTVALPLI